METKQTDPPKRARKKRKRQHGSGGIYKRGGKFLIKWREGGRQRYETFADEELAKRALAKITKDIEIEGAGFAVEKPPSPALSTLFDKWMERRTKTHRSAGDDASRWRVHLKQAFGTYRPDDVDEAAIRRFIEAKIAAGLNTATVGLCVRLLSTFYSDLVEQGHAKDNPPKRLRRSTRRLCRPTHDPKDTPFLERTEDIRAVFLKLPAPYGLMFAVGALAGLRTGEILALEWRDVDLSTGRIHVHQQARHGKLGPLKDNESRIAPVQAALLPLFADWKLKTGGEGLMFKPPVRRGRKSKEGTAFVKDATLNKHLQDALKACKLKREGLGWYQCTRHTFASQWVLGGGSIEKLSKVLGHSDVRVTMRYMHLRPDLFQPEDLRLIRVDLARPAGDVVHIPVQRDGIGCSLVTEAKTMKAKISKIV